MISKFQFQQIADELDAVVKQLKSPGTLTRTEVGDIRVAITVALCEINSIERNIVGVPPPKSGD